MAKSILLKDKIDKYERGVDSLLGFLSEYKKVMEEKGAKGQAFAFGIAIKEINERLKDI